MKVVTVYEEGTQPCQKFSPAMIEVEGKLRVVTDRCCTRSFDITPGWPGSKMLCKTCGKYHHAHGLETHMKS